MTLLNLLVFAGFMALALCAQADPTDAFRRFSRRLLEAVPIQFSVGFVYSTELLAKCHRLGWPMAEVPAQWFKRTRGLSRFRILEWAPAYLRWYFHILQASWLLLRAVSKRS